MLFVEEGEPLESIGRSWRRPIRLESAAHPCVPAQLLPPAQTESCSVTNHLCALQFFYVQALKRPSSIADTPYPKKRRRLSTILSQEEVGHMIDGSQVGRTLLDQRMRSVPSLLFILFPATGLNAAAGTADSDFTLTYDKPASKWTKALPMGNGRIGAMFPPGTEDERRPINEDTFTWRCTNIPSASLRILVR